MMTKNDQFDSRLIDLLDELKPVPERDPRAILRGKNKFLAEAVSLSESRRQTWWTTIFYQKEKFAMNLLISVLAIAGLLFGGNATVAAAQDDLPTDTLYQIKLISEDAQLWFNTDPAVEIDLLMQQAQTRTEEMAALNSMGVIPPTALTTRTQDRIDQALQVVSTLDETEVAGTLLQIRDRLQTQDQLLSRLQDGTCTDCEPTLERTRDMLHVQLTDVENGLADPQGFIHRHRNQAGIATAQPTDQPTEISVTDEPTEVATEEAPATESPVVVPQKSSTPVLDGAGQQSGSQGTPEPQKGSGKQGGNNQSDESKQKGSDDSSGKQNGKNP